MDKTRLDQIELDLTRFNRIEPDQTEINNRIEPNLIGLKQIEPD